MYFQLLKYWEINEWNFTFKGLKTICDCICVFYPLWKKKFYYALEDCRKFNKNERVWLGIRYISSYERILHHLYNALNVLFFNNLFHVIRRRAYTYFGDFSCILASNPSPTLNNSCKEKLSLLIQKPMARIARCLTFRETSASRSFT